MTTPAPAETPTTDTGNQPDTPPETTAPAPTPPEPAAPATPTQPEPAEPKTTDEPKGKTPKFEGDFDPAKFQKLVENLRGDVAAEKAKREAAEQKAKDDQAAFMKKVAGAFGIETDEQKPPTPEELAKQLEESRGETKASRDETRQMQVELAVYRTAARHGGDPDALLDSRTFAKVVAKLDPSAGDFDDAVGKAVKAAVEGNAKLAAKQPEPTPKPETAPAGGADMGGSTGSKRQLTGADVARMTPSEIAKATAEGRLNSYLSGKAG
ncbi:hypothetical protein ACN2WE_05100 [Streptomyces sp. cg28]|uniref:hypothetical protein n=1 Tax=Streptomyces sp. cg28 TaxID=3403457 RepID=UPI003B2147F0